MSVEIDYAAKGDLAYLLRNDTHVPGELVRERVERHEIIVPRLDGQPIGWLRFGYFWDLVPFMNMLAVDEEHRRRGYGSRVVAFWEREMHGRGYERVMTSTQADEEAQHFYRHLGYRDCGSVLFPGQLPLEVFLIKELS